MSCLPTCRRPAGRQAHCGACHRTFGSVTAFDAHRRAGGCLDPADAGMVERGGLWRQPMSEAYRATLNRQETP